jgi:hypothetical protein
MDEAIRDAVKGEYPDCVGADPEIGRVSEADEAGIAEDQVEAQRGNREDHHACEYLDVKGCIGGGGDRRHQRQRGERDQRDDISRAEAS